jgi:hypothetical protein
MFVIYPSTYYSAAAVSFFAYAAHLSITGKFIVLSASALSVGVFIVLSAKAKTCRTLCSCDRSTSSPFLISYIATRITYVRVDYIFPASFFFDTHRFVYYLENGNLG